MLGRLLRRQIFMHPAHGRIGVSSVAMAWPEGHAEMEEPDVVLRPARVGLVGASDDGWAGALALVMAYLADDERLEIGLVGDYDDGSDPLGFDCLMLLGRPAMRDARQTERLREYCDRGGSIVALGSAGAALPGWSHFCEDVLGVVGQGPVVSVPLEVEPVREACRHPVLQGVEPFRAHGDPVLGPRPADDAAMLLTGRARGLAGPVAWLRAHQRGRVFYGSFAKETDFRQPGLLRLLANAIFWTVD